MKKHSKIAPKFAIPWEKGPVAKFKVCGEPDREKAFREDPLVPGAYLAGTKRRGFDSNQGPGG